VPAQTAGEPTATQVGAGCSAPEADRWKLLREGDAWQQSATAGQPIAATRGCSGSAAAQDDGLSLWVLPSYARTVLAAGAEATLELDAGRVVRRLTVSFRGFLKQPRDWILGLYASTGTPGATPVAVATCTQGRCDGPLRLVRVPGGKAISAGRSRRDPDLSNLPATATFVLPAGTRSIAWQLRCAAPTGCPLAPVVNARGLSLRPRDPLGQPAIFSLYRIGLHSRV
jgi:hypothetical protein